MYFFIVENADRNKEEKLESPITHHSETVAINVVVYFPLIFALFSNYCKSYSSPHSVTHSTAVECTRSSQRGTSIVTQRVERGRLDLGLEVHLDRERGSEDGLPVRGRA